MTVFTFVSMKMMMDKNMPDSAKEGPMAQSQTIMLYALPVILAVTGVNFPIGVLVYWTFTNLWSYFQQLYVIRNLPTPNTEAERRMHARQIAKGKEPKRLTLATADGGKDSGSTALGDDDAKSSSEPVLNPTSKQPDRLAQGGSGGQRAQPVRRKKSNKSKKKRKKN